MIELIQAIDKLNIYALANNSQINTLRSIFWIAIICLIGAIAFSVIISYQWPQLSSDQKTIFTVLLTASYSLSVAMGIVFVQHWAKKRMLFASLATILKFILKELPTERILTTDERKEKYDLKEVPKEEIHNSKYAYEIITMFNRNEVSPFNPSVLNEIINSGYFNNVLVNLVNLQLALESYKLSRDYLYYNALEDDERHNFNVRMLNKAISSYLEEIKYIKKELNI